MTARVSPPGPVLKGSRVTLVCEATAGDPPISYSWISPIGKELISGSNSGNILVTFSASRDFGSYECIGSNRFGINKSQVNVLQADPGIIIIQVMSSH